MSEEMTSWRSLASSAHRSIKGYVAQRDWKKPSRDTRSGPQADDTVRPSLRQWASQTIRAIAQPNGTTGTEKVALFPGWAHRRYNPADENTQPGAPAFDIELFISGYASQYSSGFTSSRGRALLYMAKYYAALPKLRADDPSGSFPNSFPADDELLASMHLPARPDDMTDEVETAELLAQMRNLSTETSSISTNESSSSSSSCSEANTYSRKRAPPSYTDLQKFHNNLETRLQPFVSSSISNRPVRVSVYATDPSEMDFKSPPLGAHVAEVDYAVLRSPIITEHTFTATDGSFQVKLTVPWRKICAHPAAVNIAYGNPDEHALYVVAELLPGPPRPPSPSGQLPYAARAPRPATRLVMPTTTTYLTIPISHSKIRLISDIDDTVKMSGILSGAKATFRNVFVNDLSDSVIPGMGEWYTELWKQGVRFHYVSNSPFELLPVINDFMTLSRLPPGSVKLKSYAGRSLFTDLLRAPAERKRSGILDVLESFPDAQFFLVGDSGEQDMELYAALARERPRQILAVFIRDASNRELVKPLEDPTGEHAFSLAANNMGSIRRMSQAMLTPGGTSSVTENGNYGTIKRPLRSVSGNDVQTPTPTYAVRQPKRTQSAAVQPSSYPSSISSTETDYFTHSPLSDSPPTSDYPPTGFSKSTSNNRNGSDGSVPSPTSSRPSSGRTSSTASLRGFPAMSDSERRQYELQLRVYKARMEMPPNIPLRVFRQPEECVEAKQVLYGLNFGMAPMMRR